MKDAQEKRRENGGVTTQKIKDKVEVRKRA